MIQSIFFLVLLQVISISRIKIVWTLHNKRSHSGNNYLVKSLLYSQMLKKSDLIITHAEDGLKYVCNKTPRAFIHHPIRAIDYGEPPPEMPAYDLIIWGTIASYKGIDTFLDFLKEKGILQNYSILIAGKVTSDELSSKLEEFLSSSDQLTLMDEYVPEPKLMSLIKKSRIVLFTYHSASVLSSGALMDSISQGASIVGPDTGSFKDLSEIELIETFRDYDQLVEKIDLLIKSTDNREKQQQKIRQFVKDNSWDHFSITMSNLMKKYLE